MAGNSSSNPGTNKDDTINGTGGADSLTGGGGNDTLTGGSGGDYLAGDAPLKGSGPIRFMTGISARGTGRPIRSPTAL